MAKKVQKNTRGKTLTPATKSQPKRKPTARGANKRPALEKRFFSKIKQQYFDVDYLEILSEKDKDYYNSFMEETLNARFNHKGKKLIKSKTKKREIFRENNKRNIDVFGVANATGRMIDISPEIALEQWQEENLRDYENTQELKKESLEDQQCEVLTKREYIKMIRDGADIPLDMQAYYEARYKISTLELRKQLLKK
jgi:hypothetical protein